MIKYTNKKASKSETGQVIPFLDKLYDITFCQCVIYLCNDNNSGCNGCHYGAHISCTCSQQRKLPKKDLQWLYYQRRKDGDKSIYQMSVNDTEETRRKYKSMKRKLDDMGRELKAQNIIEDSVVLASSTDSSTSSKNSADNQNQPSNSIKNHNFKVTNTAAASIRFGV